MPEDQFREIKLNGETYVNERYNVLFTTRPASLFAAFSPFSCHPAAVEASKITATSLVHLDLIPDVDGSDSLLSD
jgi:hypothetical protein